MTNETPYAIICKTHGQVFLSEEEYIFQLERPDSKWECTICGEISGFDDNNYEKYLED